MVGVAVVLGGTLAMFAVYGLLTEGLQWYVAVSAALAYGLYRWVEPRMDD